jgi:hypothetical protein
LLLLTIKPNTISLKFVTADYDKNVGLPHEHESMCWKRFHLNA